jgi:hypothetical protein
MTFNAARDFIDHGRTELIIAHLWRQPGTVASLGMTAKLEVYLTTKAGKYCDMVEQLVYNHLAKGDQVCCACPTSVHSD